MQDPEKRERRNPGRRSFTLEYKLSALARALEMRMRGRGRMEAFLREEGLRRSHLAEWRKQLERGAIGNPRRGRPSRSREELSEEIRRGKRRIHSLENKMRVAEAIIQLQRKYIAAAAIRLARKDRGLLSEILAKVDRMAPVSAACRALALSRRDYYRTVRHLREKIPMATGIGREEPAKGRIA